MQPFSHQVRRQGRIVVLALRGNLDSAAAFAFDRAITQVLGKADAPVVFDCERLEFLSSSGIRSFVVARNLTKVGGGRVVVCNLPPHIRQVIRLAGLDAVLGVFGTRAEALAACAG